MAMNKTTYAIGAVLDTILVPGKEVVRPTALYMALHTGAPGAAGDANELSVGNGYGRKLVTFADTAVPYVSEADALYGPCTTAAWGNCTHGSLWDAETGGNAWYQGPLTTARYIDVDDQLRIPAGDVQISEN